MITHLSRASCLSALGALILVSLHAQAPTPPQQPSFRTEANLVRVDVYATSNGEAVRDLAREDFELLEDGRPQKIETFERIDMRPLTAEPARRDPNSAREAASMAADARARVIVLFLDTYHVDSGSSMTLTTPLVHTLDRFIGPDDLVGVMTPEMSAVNLVLARKGTSIESMLKRYANWGRRDDLAFTDAQEVGYERCYPPAFGELGRTTMAMEMIDRRREKRTLDAAEDLVVHLGSLRDERTAILTISEGWMLFKPNERMLAQVPEARAGVFVTPEGKLTMKDPRNDDFPSQSECDADRMRLANLDNERQFLDLLGMANRANASFYAIDPRGIAVFDGSLERGDTLTPSADRRRLSARLQTMRTLAEATDGLAILNSNDIEAGLKQVITDLGAYYLLGYYSDNSRFDGKFRSIAVKSTRSGVRIRARRGYRAPTEDEANLSRATRPAAAAAPFDASLRRAIASLRPDSKRSPLLLRATWARDHPSGGDVGTSAVAWVTTEVQPGGAAWTSAAAVSVLIAGPTGATVASGRSTLAASSRSIVTELALRSFSPGRYSAQIRAAPAGGEPLLDVVEFTIPEAQTSLAAPLAFRGGARMASSLVPAADLRFRRTERLRFELPLDRNETDVRVRLYDAAGHPLTIPITISSRADPQAGRLWLVADVTLAPLAAGDYVVEFQPAGRPEGAAMEAFRVVP